MSTLKDVAIHPFADRHAATDWEPVLRALVPDVHPVDRDALRIWFSFWPLWLREAIEETDDPVTLERRYQLDGRYRLDSHLVSSVEILYGARWWTEVRAAVLETGRRSVREISGISGDLEGEIRTCAVTTAVAAGIGADLLLAVTAVAVAALQQLGPATFAAIEDKPASHHGNRDPQAVIRSRKKQRTGLRRVLGPGGYTVRWDSRDPSARFQAEPGQNLTMAAATDERDHRAADPRRVEGPIPVQCRSGACGYCWTGVLGGRTQLSPIGDFERERLEHFGYRTRGVADDDTHPAIRLSCQCTVHGDVSITLPTWNGVHGD